MVFEKIIICGNYGASNVGDESILKGLLNLMYSYNPKIKLWVMSAKDIRVAQDQKLEQIRFWPVGIRSSLRFWFGGEFVKTFKAFWEADAMILGGGGLFTDEKLKAILIWSVQVMMALIFKKKLLMIGQSVGPIRRNWVRKIVRYLFNKAEKTYVRDHKSLTFLKEISVESHIEVLTDMAFGMDLSEQHFHNKKNYIVLSLRPWMFGDMPEIYKNIALFVDYIVERYDYEVWFVGFQEVIERDLDCFDELLKYVKNKEKMVKVRFTEDVNAVLEVLGHAKALVGMRLHSLILATMVRTPFLAISYSQKVRSMVHDFGFREILDYENLSFDDLKQGFDEVMVDYNERLIKLDKLAMKNRYQAFDLVKKLKEAS